MDLAHWVSLIGWVIFVIGGFGWFTLAAPGAYSNPYGSREIYQRDCNVVNVLLLVGFVVGFLGSSVVALGLMYTLAGIVVLGIMVGILILLLRPPNCVVCGERLDGISSGEERSKDRGGPYCGKHVPSYGMS